MISERFDTFYSVSFKGHTFYVSSVASSMPRWLLDSFIYENDIREQWWNIKNGDIVIDVGAAYGSYTLSALAAGAAFVFAFEPGKEELFDITTNLFCNPTFSGKYVVSNRMVGDSTNKILRYCPGTHTSETSLRVEGVVEDRLTISIDDLAAAYSFPRLDWIKIDVEGAEESVLQGSANTLKKYKPTVLVENHVMFVPDVLDKIRKFMIPLGYSEKNITRADNNNWSLWESEIK